MKLRLLLYLCAFSIFIRSTNAQDQIQLGGTWQFAIDSLDHGIEEQWFAKNMKETVILPGSMTENRKGNEITISTHWTGDILDSSYFKLPQYEKYRQSENIKVPFWLQPEKYYVGAAWYRKVINIPSDWKGKSIELFFERCHWQSSVWIDAECIGIQNALGAPHMYDLTAKLSPGKHSITVCIDNRIKEINPGVNSSSLTDHSQTNWNGIVGKMYLKASNAVNITSMKLFPDIYQKKVSITLQIENRTEQNQKVDLSAQAVLQQKSLLKQSKHIELQPGSNEVSLEYEMGNDALLWDEFSPNLYSMKCEISNKHFRDEKEEAFGLRKIATKKTQFTINDRLMYLRGTLECAVFPKTGYPPTDEKEWTRILKVCKAYGLNHMRFHSWCPPEAAFSAADRIGMYLYVECSSWANQGATIGDGKPIDKYMYDESDRIINAYGNHP
ncbi:MAG: sugar-binding domain-containing protein, partial [Bacteroidota bacterium]